MKLTQRRIENVACPLGKKDVLIFDDEQRGLGVRVSQNAKPGSLAGKSYLAQYWLAGGSRRVRLGACAAISLAAAREATMAILGDVAKGRDPVADRKEARQKAKAEALTLEDLIGRWDKLHLAGKRPNYAAAATSALRRAFAKHLNEPVAKLGRDTVVRVLDGLAKDDKAAMASATARYGSALFSWAADRGSLSTNPFARVPTASAVERDRVLSDEELSAVWTAAEGPGPYSAIVRMLILTGQRREEVANLAWDELAPDLSVWTIPAARAKNGSTHIVPLSAQAQALLLSQPPFEGVSLVFPGERGAFSGWSKSKARLDKAAIAKLRKRDPEANLPNWTLHDLRRTVATGLQRLGVRLEVTEAILNHVSGSRAGIVGVYQRHHWTDEKRAALVAWGAHVAALVEGRETERNVTPIRARAGAV